MFGRLFTVKEVKKVLREQTHGGKYWNAKPHHTWFSNKVWISGPADYVEINLKTGEGYYKDNNDD